MSRLRILLWMCGFALLMGAILFGSAGRTDLPMYWIYLGLWLAFGTWAALSTDEDLWKERMHPGPGARDNLAIVRVLAILGFAGTLILPGIDAGRGHWTDSVPIAVQIISMIGFAVALIISTWARTVNRFFSSAVRIQTDRGHYVITDGPYRLIRHPGYLGFILVSIFTGPALGSWLGLLPPLIILATFIRRAAVEDSMLRSDLPGYAEYAGRVRYRLVPGVW